MIPHSCVQPKAGCWLGGDNKEGKDWLQIDLNRTQFIQDVTLDFRRDEILKYIKKSTWENIQVLIELSDPNQSATKDVLNISLNWRLLNLGQALHILYI